MGLGCPFWPPGMLILCPGSCGLQALSDGQRSPPHTHEPHHDYAHVGSTSPPPVPTPHKLIVSTARQRTRRLGAPLQGVRNGGCHPVANSDTITFAHPHADDPPRRARLRKLADIVVASDGFDSALRAAVTEDADAGAPGALPDAVDAHST